MRRYQLIPSHAVQTLLITSVSPLPSGEIGAPYSFTFNAIGGVAPYSWSEVGAIPSGLTFSGGTLSGTPTGTFSSSFNVTVTDSVGSQFTRAFSLTVITAVQITTASPLPGGTVGVAYSTTIAATGGATPYSWSILGFTGANSYSINSVTGMLTGTLGVAEIDSINIQVVDALGIPSAKNFNLTVIPAASLTITTSSPLPAATQSSAYSTTMAATGGTPPYTWSLTSHTGSNTWSVSSAGVVTGAPGTIETDSLVIKVTDSVLATASGTFSLTVSAPVSGFLPAGHWIPAKLPMALVYPRPDAETGTFARHRWAYYDGVNPVQYKIPIGVNFGAFPYVYSLDSGSIALGMSFGASGWNTSWGTGSNTGFQDAAAAGYGYLLWTPTASVSGHTVTITVTDQQLSTLTITFTVSTSSSTAQFIFVDAVNGNDSTGTGTISAPWQSFTKATTGNANALLYLRQGTYAVVSSGTVGGDQNVRYYTLNTSSQPSALMAFPGDTAPIISMTNSAIVSTTGTEMFWQGLNFNDYDHSAYNVKLYWQQNTGVAGYRQTFDLITWTNSGVTSGGGASPGDDIAGPAFYFDGNNSAAPTLYQFINNYTESNRANSGRSGNNYIGCTTYGVQFTLVQGSYFNQAGYSLDNAYYYKVNAVSCCLRGNTIIVGSGTYSYASSTGQPLSGTMDKIESCYNTMVGAGFGLALGQSNITGYGSLWAYRNSVAGSGGFFGGGIGSFATGATLLEYDNNAVQTTGSLPSGSFTTTSGNILASSGVLDSNGKLTATYISDLGIVGAQIA